MKKSTRFLVAAMLCVLLSPKLFAQGSDTSTDLSIRFLDSAYFSNEDRNIKISLEEYGQGTNYLPMHSVAMYLSMDTLWDENDRMIMEESIREGYPTTYIVNSEYQTWLDIEAGNYYIIGVSDYRDEIPEINESNNVAIVPFIVSTSDVDLSLDLSDTKPLTGFSNGIIPIEYRINNSGTTPASEVIVAYNLSKDTIWDENDVSLYYTTINEVGPQISQILNESLYFPDNIDTGNYFVLFKADYSNDIKESNENNNSAYIPIQIIAPVINLKWTSGNVDSIFMKSNYYYSTFNLLNESNAYVDTIDYGLYLSKDTIYDADDYALFSSYIMQMGPYDSLSPYAPYSINTYDSVDFQPGKYYVLQVIDAANKINETNEHDNIHAFPVTYVLPDIIKNKSNQNNSHYRCS